jgi:hypothetical protein
MDSTTYTTSGATPVDNGSEGNGNALNDLLVAAGQPPLTDAQLTALRAGRFKSGSNAGGSNHSPEHHHPEMGLLIGIGITAVAVILIIVIAKHL